MQHRASTSYDEWEIEQLRRDPELARAYLQEAVRALDDSEDQGAALLALRNLAQANGGLGPVAQRAGISREALYRALSPNGNPTLKTLQAVLKAVGMRLSVEPLQEHTAVAH
mgnify:CR=1 FL=1